MLPVASVLLPDDHLKAKTERGISKRRVKIKRCRQRRSPSRRWKRIGEDRHGTRLGPWTPPKRFFRSLMANDIGRHVQADVSNPLTLEDSHEHLNGLGLHWGWVRQQLIWFGVKFRLFTSWLLLFVGCLPYMVTATVSGMVPVAMSTVLWSGSRCYVDGWWWCCVKIRESRSDVWCLGYFLRGNVYLIACYSYFLQVMLLRPNDKQHVWEPVSMGFKPQGLR